MNDPLRHAMRFCPSCAEPLARLSASEDGGEKERLRCAACGWTHWNNPVPVLAAVVAALNRHSRQADGRAYAGGLTKFEPGDLLRLKLPDPFIGDGD